MLPDRVKVGLPTRPTITSIILVLNKLLERNYVHTPCVCVYLTSRPHAYRVHAIQSESDCGADLAGSILSPAGASCTLTAVTSIQISD